MNVGANFLREQDAGSGGARTMEVGETQRGLDLGRAVGGVKPEGTGKGKIDPRGGEVRPLQAPRGENAVRLPLSLVSDAPNQVSGASDPAEPERSGGNPLVRTTLPPGGLWPERARTPFDCPVARERRTWSGEKSERPCRAGAQRRQSSRAHHPPTGRVAHPVVDRVGETGQESTVESEVDGVLSKVVGKAAEFSDDVVAEVGAPTSGSAAS